MSSYWSDLEFIEIIKTSKTISEVLKHFNCPRNQGYYNRIFHETVKRLNIDISHLKATNKNNISFKKIPTEQLLVKNRFTNTKDLKKRLIKENLLNNICYICSIPPMWNDKKLSLHLDHINGDNTDNRLENLRILCPNCHSQTETYCGAKSKKEKYAYKYVCKTCRGPKRTTKSEVCNNCQYKQKRKTKIEWPKPEIVLDMVQKENFSKVAKKLKVSYTAIKKYLKKHNLI